MDINHFYDKPQEECGIFGASLRVNEAAAVTYNGLLALQHRGQEGAGIAVVQGNRILHRKSMGLVTQVFHSKGLSNLASAVAIGHNRYASSRKTDISTVQPFVYDFLTGRIATVHNGCIVNAKPIRDRLSRRGVDFEAATDSEVISGLIAYRVMQTKDIQNMKKDADLVKGIVKAASELKGAFCLLVMDNKQRLVACRDPHGFRPLCIGRNEHGMVVASETCALDSCGFEFVRDVRPGEVVVIENGEIVHEEIMLPPNKESACIFEYVYFARPDSIIDGQSVFESRYEMGRRLAKEHVRDADIVCGVPESGLISAMGYAAMSGIPLSTAFVKNHYLGRSFIYPTQAQRVRAVGLKLNPLRATVAGKRVVLVDDSIVRGTTCAKIISSLREAGAKEVHMMVSSPPFRHLCHFGTDIESEDVLIARKLTVDEICREIGADSLGYLSEEGLVESCGKCSLGMCTGCFSGEYAIDVDAHKEDHLD